MSILLHVLLVAGLGLCGPRVAQAQIPGVDEWARSVIQPFVPVQVHRQQFIPVPPERPASGITMQSWWYPVAVHAAEGVEVDQIEDALGALEQAYLGLKNLDWPPPWPDGGLGNTAGFDVYLMSDVAQAVQVVPESWLSWGMHDAMSAYGVVDARLNTTQLQACITQAYALTVLWGMDPAEAPSWHQATATYLSWLLTGYPGCDGSLMDGFEVPSQGWLTPEGQERGALFLAALSQGKDHLSSDYVHSLWQRTTQRSVTPGVMDNAPHLWEVIDAELRASDQTLDDVLQELAIGRYVRNRDVFAALGAQTSVPLVADLNTTELPKKIRNIEPALQVTGSAYVRVRLDPNANSGALRIWLTAEMGVRWALSAVRLDAQGQAHGHITAPATRDAKSYLRLELTPDTYEVLVVVTNLSHRLPDAQLEDPNTRSFSLTVDNG